MQQKIVISRNGSVLKIERVWLDRGFYFIVFFAIAWNAILISSFSLNIFYRDDNQNAQVLFLVALVVGIFLIYQVCAEKLNRTILSVSGGELEIHHRPLPWFGAKSLSLSSIDHFEVEEENTEGRISFHLNAVLKDDSKEKLMRPFSLQVDAANIESELNYQLLRC